MAYQLFRGDVLLGVIREETPDFPWTLGTFTPTAAFAAVRPLFDALKGTSTMQEWNDRWLQLHSPGLRLVPDDSSEPTITDFVLHIDGTRFQLKY